MDSMCPSILASDSPLQVSGMKIKKEVGKYWPLTEILPEFQKFQALDMLNDRKVKLMPASLLQKQSF